MTVQTLGQEGLTWTILPRALAVNEPPPPAISQQEFILTLTGVAIISFQGDSNGWRRDTVEIWPEQCERAATFAVDRYGIPKPPVEWLGPNREMWNVEYEVGQYHIYASPSVILNEPRASNPGFAVDRWRMGKFRWEADAFTWDDIPNLFGAILVDVAVRDNNASLYRIGYQVTLLGRPRFTRRLGSAGLPPSSPVD